MKIRCMNCMKEYEEEGHECCPECGFVRGTPPKEIYHLHPEVVLADRYIIGTVVAYGGFGVIYRAWDTKLEVMVAVKEYFPANYVNRNPGEKEIFIYTSKKQGEFQAGLEGFLEEARNTSKFSTHPNIVNVYDYFKENGTAYMVMEFMDGISLKQYTKEKGGKISWQEAVPILASICDVLKVVHDAGILHRDISPDNIMLCRDGRVKLFDFGAARFSNLEKEVTRTVILKIGFAPPEQYRQKSKQGPRTDIYAMGATLYRTVTGVLPDESENRRIALLKKEKDPLLHPKQLEPELPDYLDHAIMKAMAVQPELRFKNILQFKDAILNKKPAANIEEELKRRKRLRKAGICGVVAVIAAASLGCFTYYREKRSEAYLTAVDLPVWISLKDGETQEEKQVLFEAMAEEFSETYPQVTLSLTCIPEGEYEEELKEAKDKGTFPVLYESTILNENFADRMEDLSDILTLVAPEDYYILSGLVEENGELKQLPLGFSLPVVYGNSSLSEEQETGKNDETAFFGQENKIWLSDTASYQRVQKEMPGIYTIEAVETESLPGSLGPLWSVDAMASNAERQAAKRLLYYFLGENAQDVLHIQNDTSLPVNKNEFQVYVDINQELAFLKEKMDAGVVITFLNRESYEKELESLYETITSSK